MRKLIAPAMFLLLSLTFSAQHKKSTSVDQEQQVLQAEHAWLVAASTPDATAMNNLLSEDFIGTTPGGTLVHKSDLMPTDDASNKLPKMHAENPTIQLHGDTAVLMAKLVTDGGDRAMNSTSVFRLTNGKWSLAALQLSPAPK